MMVAKGMSPVHVRLRSRLVSLSAASVALDLVTSAVIYVTEQGRSGTGINTFGDALPTLSPIIERLPTRRVDRAVEGLGVRGARAPTQNARDIASDE